MYVFFYCTVFVCRLLYCCVNVIKKGILNSIVGIILTFMYDIFSVSSEIISANTRFINLFEITSWLYWQIFYINVEIVNHIEAFARLFSFVETLFT